MQYKSAILGGIMLTMASISSGGTPTLKNSQIYMATLHTQQYETMFNFYADTLQLPVLSENEGFAEFSVNGLRLSLASYQTLDGFLDSPDLQLTRQGTGVGVGFKLKSQKEVDELYQQMKLQNVEFIAPPTAQPWGEYTTFFRDPDGNIHEIVADLPN
ncbi:VOC family protein [Aliamphritea hakodatensis]|uniref:VOC family protein n=1 Tax=Aliamphritea hakodatensis TaxID=2895352 RepID=UPI0022FD45F0|nr:VOC family protein [Aliamphritea hakodatensis]